MGTAPERRRKPPRRGVATAVVVLVLVFLVFKGRGFLVGLAVLGRFVLGGLRLGQLLANATAIALAAYAYALRYGWPFPAALVLWVAVIAAGGPVVAAAASVATAAASWGVVGGEPAGFLRAAGYYGSILCLLDLLPVWRLAGARMLARVEGRLVAAGGGTAFGIAIVAAAIAEHVNPFALVVAVACAIRGGLAIWRERREGRAPPGPRARRRMRRAAALYTATLAVLTIAVHALHGSLPAVAR